MLNIDLELLYRNLCRQESDIYLHLPVLRAYAADCRHVTEFGMRTGVSTAALLAAQPDILTTHDVNLNANVARYLTRIRGRTVFFALENDVVKMPPMGETEMLFIDTLHTYRQMRAELDLHGNRAAKYLAFHDWVTFAWKDEVPGKEPGTKRGIRLAIEEFMAENRHWKISAEYKENNGLLVLERSTL